MKGIRRGIAVWLFALAATAQTPAPSLANADDLISQARQVYTQQGAKAALPEFERLLALFQQSNDRRREAITLGFMGNCYRRLGDLPRALDFVERGITIKQGLGDNLEVGRSENQLGLIYWDMANYPQAITHLQRAVATGRETKDLQLEGQALNNLGLV